MFAIERFELLSQGCLCSHGRNLLFFGSAEGKLEAFSFALLVNTEEGSLAKLGMKKHTSQGFMTTQMCFIENHKCALAPAQTRFSYHHSSSDLCLLLPWILSQLDNHPH